MIQVYQFFFCNAVEVFCNAVEEFFIVYEVFFNNNANEVFTK
jgi:hypothetical protein